MKKVLWILGVFVLILISSATYAFMNADKLGATPSGKIAKDAEIPLEKAEKVLEVFQQIGIDEYTSLVHDELLDNANAKGESGYRLNTKDAQNVIVYLDSKNTVNTIKYADNILYSEGSVKSQLDDFVLTNNEMTNLQLQAEETIKTLLKSPSTAKFPNILDWNMWIEGDITYVQSYVDAQNGFGAELRSEFQLKIQDDTIISLIFDGKEFIQ
ncbi:hypothetical protein MTP04_02770 [Lysinibacillus sp. PLM2]|nr:hypothetical protein MTP04_02770 [Lysinibacillus sp. PLM2]